MNKAIGNFNKGLKIYKTMMLSYAETSEELRFDFTFKYVIITYLDVVYTFVLNKNLRLDNKSNFSNFCWLKMTHFKQSLP